jgi:hypothetical protein
MTGAAEPGAAGEVHRRRSATDLNRAVGQLIEGLNLILERAPQRIPSDDKIR